MKKKFSSQDLLKNNKKTPDFFTLKNVAYPSGPTMGGPQVILIRTNRTVLCPVHRTNRIKNSHF